MRKFLKNTFDIFSQLVTYEFPFIYMYIDIY